MDFISDARDHFFNNRIDQFWLYFESLSHHEQLDVIELMSSYAIEGTIDGIWTDDMYDVTSLCHEMRKHIGLGLEYEWNVARDHSLQFIAQ